MLEQGLNHSHSGNQAVFVVRAAAAPDALTCDGNYFT